MSATTADGGQNVPIAFFERVPLTPVLPPMLESTMARRVVGTATRRIPRSQIEASTIDLLSLEEGQHVAQLGHRLRSLAGPHHVYRWLHAGGLDGLRDPARPGPDVGVGHDHSGRWIQPADDVAQLTVDIGADDHGVAAPCRIDDQPDHRRKTSAATTSGSALASTV